MLVNYSSESDTDNNTDTHKPQNTSVSTQADEKTNAGADIKHFGNNTTGNKHNNNNDTIIDLTEPSHHDSSQPHHEVASRFIAYYKLQQQGIHFINELHKQPSFYDPLLHQQMCITHNIQQYSTNINYKLLPLHHIIGQPVDNYLALTAQQEIQAKLKHQRIVNTDTTTNNNNNTKSASGTTDERLAQITNADQQRKVQAAIDKINAKIR